VDDLRGAKNTCFQPPGKTDLAIPLGLGDDDQMAVAGSVGIPK